LDGAGVEWARKFGLNWSGKGWSIWLELELESNGLNKWARILEWSWGQKSWNFWLELESNGLKVLGLNWSKKFSVKYLVGAGFTCAGIFGWRWSQMGWNIWIELVWNIWMEKESNGLESLLGAGV
jgi:hypothetical protein